MPDMRDVPTLSELLPVAIEAVDRASEMIREQAPGIVTMKSDRNPASEVDYAVERVTREFLLAAAPGVGFIGEEDGRYGDADAKLAWALDPVDGTVNFIAGLPLCGVSLGLVIEGRPAIGVVDLPFLGERYSAVAGLGAYCNSIKIAASTVNNLQDTVVSLGDYAVGANATAKNADRIKITRALADRVQRVRMLGSAAIDLVWVAAGRLGASVMLANKPWDTTAGVLIAREAGALVLDLHGHEHVLDSTATIAVAPGIADEFVLLLQEAVPA